MSHRPSGRSNAAIAAWPSKKLSVSKSTTRLAAASLPMAKWARWVAGVTVDGIWVRPAPSRRDRRTARRADAPARAGPRPRRVAMAAHVAAGLFMLDEQPPCVGVECQPPAVVVGAFAALVERLSQQG